MVHEIGFKSYCWAVGTTSFRMDQFNVNIERQLGLMKEFRELPENQKAKWSSNRELQVKYYDFMKAKGFIQGEAGKKDKDARQKTSGLRDIGLLDDERNLTKVGERLLEISLNEDFTSDNLLEIPKDSYIFFKQMMKTSNVVEGKVVRPFIVFLYVLSKTEYLTYEEFTYLLPLCVDRVTTEKIIEKIYELRTGVDNYENTILSILLEMDNYQSALVELQSNKVTEELICKVGMNRKSPKYDKSYFVIYELLKQIVFAKEDVTLQLYESTYNLTNSKVGGAWRRYLFNSSVRSVIAKVGISALNTVAIFRTENINSFNLEFFKLMHLYKAKATLSDYFDLNRRYFKATDIVIFEDGKVKLDVMPSCYLAIIGDKLSFVAYKQCKLLEQDVELEEIDSSLKIESEQLYQKLSELFGVEILSSENARQVVKNERYERFNKLIDEKFDTHTLIKLLTDFEERNDDEIRKAVTDNAEIYTIFEYVLGIAWYVISERKGDVLDYMNLSLEADLLPKTHAKGGEADIVWKYDETVAYPKHTLLIEATLAEKNSQRRMEMEPVSRHLGDYVLANPEEEAYCVFFTTNLHINVISDFRMRKRAEYYNSAGTDYITGMKILPMQTTELKTLLEFQVQYPTIYRMLDSAYNSDGAPKEWYEKNIVRETVNYHIHNNG